MAAKVLITLADPDAVLAAAAYGAASVIQLQRATTEAFSSPTDVTEIPIVASTFAYTAFDADGDRSSWYRWRVENAGDTELGEWTDPVQGWDPVIPGRLSGSYANPDDFATRLENPLTSRQSHRLARLDQALRDANGQLTDEIIGFSFFKSVADETLTFDGDGTGVLHVHRGIVTLTGVRVKLTASADWTDVEDTDWRLEYWADRGSPHVKPDGEPWDHVVFTGTGSQTYWPRVGNGAELVGIFGWPAVSATARQAEIDLARQALNADPSGAAAPVGPKEFGGPSSSGLLLPQSVYRLQRAISHRHTCDI